MQPKRITIYDIAQEAGVSPTTVSRVIAGHNNVSPKTRLKVQKIIDKHHFTPSSIAQGLLHKRSLTLGMVLPGITHPYYAQMFTGAYKEAVSRGYALILFAHPQEEALSSSILEQVARRRVDGMILSGSLVEATPQEELLIMLKNLRRSMPLVTVSPPIPGLDAINIYSDLTSSVRQSIIHLYSLGHRRIAFLGGSLESRSAGERETGFLSEMKKLSLPTVYLHEAGHTLEAGQLGVIKLFSSLGEKKPPTALICINDLVALGAIHQLKEMCISVPEQVAVIGCDNQFFTPFTNPPIT
ncbi:MAG: LacI family transcriptional regulator, partial [Clostridiales bacterium]|nr:LacI family transcriptional regulator [Clostridiales bacterium]